MKWLVGKDGLCHCAACKLWRRKSAEGDPVLLAPGIEDYLTRGAGGRRLRQGDRRMERPALKAPRKRKRGAFFVLEQRAHLAQQEEFLAGAEVCERVALLGGVLEAALRGRLVGVGLGLMVQTEEGGVAHGISTRCGTWRISSR